MKSNPQNVCIDPAEFNMAYAETKFSFTSGASGSLSETPINTFYPDTSPDPDKVSDKITDVWRICGYTPRGYGHEKIAEVLAPFAGRHSYNASYNVVVYACELDDLGLSNETDTANIKDFMQDMGKFIQPNLNEDENLYLLSRHDTMAEKFYFDKMQNGFVSLPADPSSKLLAVNSERGLQFLEDHLSDQVKSAKSMSFDDERLNPVVIRLDKILKAAGIIQQTENKHSEANVVMAFEDQIDQVCIDPLEIADNLLKIIQEEKAKHVRPEAQIKLKARKLTNG